MMKFDVTQVQTMNGLLILPLPQAADLTSVNKAISDGKTLQVQIDVKRKKRSLSANALAWTLLQKLAEKQSANGVYHSKEEIYRQLIQDSQPFYPFPCKDNQTDIQDVIEMWESRGIGWVAVDIGKAKTPGYTCIALYKGSSKYNTEEMSRLLKAIIDECEQEGIETRPQEEIDSLVASWQPADERS